MFARSFVKSARQGLKRNVSRFERPIVDRVVSTPSWPVPYYNRVEKAYPARSKQIFKRKLEIEKLSKEFPAVSPKSTSLKLKEDLLELLPEEK